MQLSRRTNVLLSEEDYSLLASHVKNQGKTMGQLIREAIKKTYFSKKGGGSQNISNEIKKGWRLLVNPKKRLDYKQLVEYGRK